MGILRVLLEGGGFDSFGGIGFCFGEGLWQAISL